MIGYNKCVDVMIKVIAENIEFIKEDESKN